MAATVAGCRFRDKIHSCLFTNQRQLKDLDGPNLWPIYCISGNESAGNHKAKIDEPSKVSSSTGN